MATSRRDLLRLSALGLVGCAPATVEPPGPPPPPPPPDPWAIRPNGRRPKDLLVIVCDDLRWDSFGFAGHPWVTTPKLDQLASQGVAFANSFVTTSLCCPSRATSFTGRYAHDHGVLGNAGDLPEAMPTWPRLLQRAGYATAFVGKWHMGASSAAPRPGWDRWIAFRGQGQYHYPGPPRLAPVDQSFNVDGTLVRQEGYVTDLLADAALGVWKGRDPKRPMALVVSHKACHAPFEPAPRHLEAFAGARTPSPMPDTDAAYAGRPNWLRRIRTGEFSADRPYEGRWPDFGSWYRDYHRTLLAVDESVGRLLAAIEDAGRLEDTAVVFTSDNGFMAGERGILDKRNFYEESIRVPWLLRAPGVVKAPGTRPDEMVLNLDLAPTLLELGGLMAPEVMEGASVVPLLEGVATDWRTEWLYEYFFEASFPQTPTVIGVRTATHKLVTYHGVWEEPELFDLGADPTERTNLATDPASADRRRGMGRRLKQLAERHGLLLEPVWAARALAEPVVDAPESAGGGSAPGEAE